MQKSPNYNFNLPDPNDPSQIADVSKISENFSALDTILKAFQDGQYVSAEVVGDDLILTKADGSTVNAGNVRGVGITRLEINTAGHLLVKYSNSARFEDLGKVKGDKGDTGATGADGEDGRGIVSVSITTGEGEEDPGDLIIAYSDGTSDNVGHVVGADGADGDQGEPGEDGVGIASVTKTGTSGLIDTYTITYTNGTTTTFDVTNGAQGAPGTIQGVKINGTALTPDANGVVDTAELKIALWKKIRVGDYSWSCKVDGGKRFFYTTDLPATVCNTVIAGNASQARSVISRKYTFKAFSSATDKTFIFGNYLAQKQLHIRDDDTAFTPALPSTEEDRAACATQFKAANANEIFYYIE